MIYKRKKMDKVDFIKILKVSAKDPVKRLSQDNEQIGRKPYIWQKTHFSNIY